MKNVINLMPEEKFRWLNGFSWENLEKIQKILKIILDDIELRGINRLTGNKIPLKKFEKEGFCYEEVEAVLKGVNKGGDIIRIENEIIEQRYENLRTERFLYKYSDERYTEEKRLLKIVWGVSEDELKNYIILNVLKLENLNRLREIKKSVDKKLREIAEIRAEEIKRQFTEMDKRQEEREEDREIIKKKVIEELKGEKEIGRRRNLITRDKISGDFYYKNKPIKFEDKETIYYLIFECLYEKGDLNGFCSYDIIDKYLVEHDQGKYTDHQQIMNRIKNGIVNLFRFSNLPPKTPDGKDLIQRVRGKGMILYNPLL